MFPIGVMNVLIAADAAKRRFKMKTFTIENETNNITIHATAQDADAVANAERFRNEAGLAKLAADWPAVRLVDIWNGLPGATPVKKFKDRATAISRIWRAIQSLGQPQPAGDDEPPAIPETDPVPDQETGVTVPQEAVISESPAAVVAKPVAPQTPDVANEKAPAKTKATRTKKTPVAATTPSLPRDGSKTSRVIELLKRKGGVTLQEIMTEMGWQSHTTRALMSAGGSLAKKHGLTVESTKRADGERTYSIKG
jgi:Protein of unknown function (DUF3489)